MEIPKKCWNCSSKNVVLLNLKRPGELTQEFVELARVPTVGDLIPTSGGLFQVKLVLHLKYETDVAAEVYAVQIELTEAVGFLRPSATSKK